MNELLQSVKADLTSRRMLPFVGLAVALLLGAIGYYAMSGATSSEPVAQRREVQAPSLPGPSVAGAPANPNSAVAETTNGGRFQHGGRIRNPFSPLREGKSGEGSGEGSQSGSSAGSSGGGGASSGAGASSGGAGGSGEASNGGGAPSSGPSGGEGPPAGGEAGGAEGSSGGGEGSSGGGEGGSSGSSGAGSEAPSLPPVDVFEVTATLRQAGEEGEAGAAEPQKFGGLDSLTVLPGKGSRLLAFAGVQDAGNGALFLLLTPAIVHGDARCLPAKTNCESIYVKPKQAEELQYEKNGTVLSYTLRVGKIDKLSVPGAQAREGAQKQVEKQLEQLEALGVKLPRDVAFSTKVPGVLSGVDAALAGARKAEAAGKSPQPSGSGE